MLTFNFKAQTSEMDSKSPTKKYIFTIFLQEGEGGEGGERETGEKSKRNRKTQPNP